MKFVCILKYIISAKPVGKIEKVHIVPIWQEKWLKFKNISQKLLFLIKQTLKSLPIVK